MKQVDLSSPPETNDPLGKAQSLINQALKSRRLRAQATLARLFSSGLSNHYVLVRNLVIPDVNPKAPGYLVPCVLVGPACLLVINPSDLHGYFRADEDNWLEMQKNSQEYRTAAHNLIHETLEMADRMNRVMQAGGLPYPEIQPVLFFANTGMHVEIVRPAVRILKYDTVERFLSSLRRVEALLDARQVQALVDYLSGLEKASQALKNQAKNMQKPLDQRVADQALTSVETLVERQNLNRKQWWILGILLAATILTLIALIVAALLFA